MEKTVDTEKKEKFDGCMRIAELATKNFHGRREFEWKITLGFWALLVGAIVAATSSEPTLAKGISSLRCLIPISILLYAGLWLRGTWVANENDKRIANNYFGIAAMILRDPAQTSPQVPDTLPPKIEEWSRDWMIGFLSDWSKWFQFVTSAALALVLWCVT